MFAAEHPAYFAVMFRPDLLQREDPALKAASQRAAAVLREAIAENRGSRPSGDPDLALESLKAWTHAHGLATLWLNGNLSPDMAPDGIAALADRLFGIDAADAGCYDGRVSEKAGSSAQRSDSEARRG